MSLQLFRGPPAGRAPLFVTWQGVGRKHTPAAAVSEGMVKDNLAFKRTEKGGLAKKRKGETPAVVGTILGGLLLAGAVWLWTDNTFKVYEQTLFAITVLIQGVPFLCTAVMGLIEEAQNRIATRRTLVQAETMR